MVAGKLSGDGNKREGALRNKTLYNFIFPLSTVGWSGSGMGVGRGRPKLLRWGEGGRCAIKLCTILFFRARRHDKAGGVLRRSPLKRPRRAMPRTARSAVLVTHYVILGCKELASQLRFATRLRASSL